MASSVQLEMSSSFAITKIGAVIRLATEAAPTKAEAEASAGYVSLEITAGSPRKFSISQHYGSDFTDGLTLADVLGPNTAYKLYLYFPSGRIPTTAELTGLSITNDIAVVPFTTTALPAAGDAQWLTANNGNIQWVASLDTYYFMQEQKGVVVCYFYTNFAPILFVSTVDANSDDLSVDNLGTYSPLGGVSSTNTFHFAYGSISGYISNPTNNYGYWIGTDKNLIITNIIQNTLTDTYGTNTSNVIPVTRY
ncbi:hypothetical protein P0082_06985 [Candidatus Haliotispira prima]|uniref:Uncharacterized protein n=1 Tax=Candidatus Haliotispira prima TaxID=3034016 RepID=A0ABY8ME22_9SPIO|nr:hypothetical protein P0082_06985 [Candidatus Haliotispira prima]